MWLWLVTISCKSFNLYSSDGNGVESYRIWMIFRPKYLKFSILPPKTEDWVENKENKWEKENLKPAIGSVKIWFWKNSKARKVLKLRLLPEGNLIPVNASGISYFCFLFLFSFYSFKFEKLGQTKLNSRKEVFYSIGGQPITYRSNVVCHIVQSRVYSLMLSFPGISLVSARNKLWVVQVILMVCPFLLFFKSPHDKAHNSSIIKISFRVIRNNTCSAIFRCHLRFADFALAE